MYETKTLKELNELKKSIDIILENHHFYIYDINKKELIEELKKIRKKISKEIKYEKNREI